jgi:hypothetical protein
MIHIVDEIKLLLLLGIRLKHIRGNVSYLVTWNVKEIEALDRAECSVSTSGRVSPNIQGYDFGLTPKVEHYHYSP